MKRRDIIKSAGILAAAGLVANNSADAAVADRKSKSNLALRVAHITDVHIRPDLGAPDKFRKCLDEIKKLKIDFFLNGGDSIFDASYNDVKRERVTELWDLWDVCIKELNGYEVHSCIGNHDTWWAAPDKSDK